MLFRREPSPLLRILCFYVLACAWSWPFFWRRDIHPEIWKAWAVPHFLKTWSIMWGPGLAALICFALFGASRRTVTFRGTSFARGLLAYVTPVLVLTLLTLDVKILLLGAVGFIATLGEELGWRGWLQDQLPIRSTLGRSLVIGAMWEVWHFTNRTAHATLPEAVTRVLMWMALCSVISFVMLTITKRTGSLMLAVTLHASINISFEVPRGWQAVLISIPIWWWLLRTWPTPSARESPVSEIAFS